MEWRYNSTAYFSGFILTNAIPLFVHGISFDKFPTPFAIPMSKGLSSPKLNVLWALLNIIIGYLLFTITPVDKAHALLLIDFFAGVAFVSIYLGKRFQNKHIE